MQQAKAEQQNLINVDELVEGKLWWAGKQAGGYRNHCATPMIPVTPGAFYYMDRNSNSQNNCSYFDSNQQYLRQVAWESAPITKEIPSDVYYIGITIGIAYKDTAVFKKV